MAATHPVLPNGRAAQEAEDVLDLYFVVAQAWRHGSELEVGLPEAFEVPSACLVRPLTPWLDEQRLSCRADVFKHLIWVRSDAALPINASVGLRLTPFRLPRNFSDLHPGRHVWPVAFDTIHPRSLNIVLRIAQIPGDPRPSDACHPAVWSCGLFPMGWTAASVLIRPSRMQFENSSVRIGVGGASAAAAHAWALHESVSAEAAASVDGAGWAVVEFSMPVAVEFDGKADEALILTAPFGYALHGIHASNLYALQLDPSFGQLEVRRAFSLDEMGPDQSRAFLVHAQDDRGISNASGGVGVGEGKTFNSNVGASALRVPYLYGRLEPRALYHVNVSLTFPGGSSSSADPSLLDPTRLDAGKGACANAWGLALKVGGEHVASAFVQARQTAYIAAFEVLCGSRALGSSENWLTFRFVTTAYHTPELSSSKLVVVFSMPSIFQLADPSIGADFAAPFLYNKTTDPPIMGSESPETPAFVKLGCPPLLVHVRGRRLEGKLTECAIFFNDDESTIDILVELEHLLPAAEHQLLVRVHNPSRMGTISHVNFALSVFHRRTGVGFWQIPVPIVDDNRGFLVRVQGPLEALACFPLLPAMKAEIHASRCLVDSRPTEVTIGFVAPVVMRAPVDATIEVPLGYSLPWLCRFNASSITIPSDKKVDYITEQDFVDCAVSSNGRRATFKIRQTLSAKFVWNFFTLHAVNTRAAEAPAIRAQGAWSLQIGGHATTGVLGPPLRLFTDLLLKELPFVYNDSSWALLLRLRSATRVPNGGHVTLTAPPPFFFPAAHCRGADEADGEAMGSSSFVPTLPAQPFRRVLDTDDGNGPFPEQPVRVMCSVNGRSARRLVVTFLEGELPAGFYEWRFPVVVNSEADLDLLSSPDVKVGPLAPMRWILESWAMPQHLSAADLDNCQARNCCPTKRPNFLAEQSELEVELLDRGVVEAYPAGSFRYRLVVADDLSGGWRFTVNPRDVTA
eukprot:TRINITY_DN22847_c0_g3_i1.p1 TRINITY_DN22847_c0_g3~~TRINITY_DN22847_c0_g3_i1.p1  ORF type:complete len:1062 (+),score=121.78 TRINITY_DN22847_c0_g3_i1:280-3186(+)